MAVQAPRHAERLIDSHDLHPVHATMARGATNAGRNVNRVVEECVIWKLMNTNPFDGLARLPALANEAQALAVRFDRLMAAHTRLGRRNHRFRRSFYVRVTVATVDAELACVEPMAICHGLRRGVANNEILRR